MTTLVVTQPFGDYAIGDQITAPDAVAAALESNPGSVVRRAEAEPEAPAATETPATKPTKAATAES
jgi:hypothetical protein